MSRYLDSLIYTVIGLLVAGGLAFAYLSEGISGDTLAFLGVLAVTLGVVAAVFIRRLSHPSESVEQMLYKADHPTRT